MQKLDKMKTMTLDNISIDDCLHARILEHTEAPYYCCSQLMVGVGTWRLGEELLGNGHFQ